MARSHFPVWLMAVLLVLVTVALYWPAMRCDFVNYDDNLYVTSNGDIYAALDRREQAAEAWRKSLSVEPNPQIQKKLSDLSAR